MRLYAGEEINVVIKIEKFTLKCDFRQKLLISQPVDTVAGS
jgi:hypothetical protein